MAKHSLQDRLKSRYDHRESGSNRMTVLDFKGEKVSFWKPKSGKNFINILPFTISSKNNPEVRSGNAEVGDEDFLLDLWIHGYVGPGNSDIICPKRNFGKPCPICEAADDYKEQGKDKESLKCRPAHRAIYNILDETDRDKGVQIWIASHKNFQQELMGEAADAGDDGKVVDFVDLKKGKVVKFRADEESFDKQKYFKFKSFKFEDREEPIPSSIKESIYNLDEYMIIHSYDKIKALFYGDDEESDDEEPKKADDEEEDDRKPSKDKDEEEEDDSSPLDDEEEKENEEEKPAGKKCPHGHKFSTDCDKFDECDDCKLYDDCYKEHRASKGKK